MALSAIKVWVAAEVLFAADLVAEFANILNNPIALISPFTGSVDVDGFDMLDADEVGLRDASADATAAGRLRRNAANLTWHDGTAAGRLFYVGGSDVPLADGGTGVGTATAYGVVIATTATRYGTTAALTNGQLVIGRTNLEPIAAVLTAGAGMTVTNAAGSITLTSESAFNPLITQAFGG